MNTDSYRAAYKRLSSVFRRRLTEHQFLGKTTPFTAKRIAQTIRLSSIYFSAEQIADIEQIVEDYHFTGASDSVCRWHDSNKIDRGYLPF